MKTILTTLAFIVISCYSPAISQAATISYSFTGQVTHMFEHDELTDTNTDVNFSNLFGFDINVGEAILGGFSYETDTPLTSIDEDWKIAVYLDGTSSFYFQTDNYYYDDLTPNGTLDAITVANDSTIGVTTLGYPDSFGVLSSNSIGQIYTYSQIMFSDHTGLIFDDYSIPTSLDLADFSGYAYFHSSLLDRQTGDQLHFYGNITNIIPAPVPEPSTILLFGSGLLGLILYCRKRKKA